MNEMASIYSKKAQVGKDQERVQSEKDHHSKNRGGKKPTPFLKVVHCEKATSRQ